MTLRALVLALSPILIIGTASAQGDRAFKELDRYFKNQIEMKASPSISVAVVKNGKVVYAKGFGFADLENDVPASPQSVYRIGSITKQFTATMIMQLVQEGKLKLDQPIRTVLPDSPEAWSQVTVQELLNHTSGIKSYTEIFGLFNDAALKPTTPAGILKTVEKAPLDFAPGTAWHYDNTGYEVLGLLIEKLDGRKYEQSLQARILNPLGMTSTYFTSERTVVKHRAQGYDPTPTGPRHAQYLNMDWPYAAGSIESTTLDLAKWDAALYGDKILPQSALKQMWTPTLLPDGKTEPYGFGWQTGSVNGTELVQHGGGIHGFITFIRRAPKKGLTVIVLTNSGSGPAEHLAVDAMGIVDPSLKVADPKAIPDADPTATRGARELLQAILDGKLDRSKLTPEFDKALTPTLEKQGRAQLMSLGAVTGFSLISSSSADGQKVRVYQVTLGKTPIKLTVSIDAKGLVSGMNLQP